jgi:hypothetical protein
MKKSLFNTFVFLLLFAGIAFIAVFSTPIFWLCVQAMVVTAKLIGISYQQLNILLFVILHPVITLWFFWRYRVYKKRYRTPTSLGSGLPQ